MDVFWTPTRLLVLRWSWGAGVSGGTIAKSLGTTRNAVMGRLNRLGLFHRGKPKAVIEQHRPGRTPSWAKLSSGRPPIASQEGGGLFRRPALPPAIEPPDPRNARSLTRIGPDQCRFISGEVKEAKTLYCGGKTWDGKAYCRYHWEVTHVRDRKYQAASREKHR